MAKKKKAEGRAGRLVIIGGAEDREGGCEILREFARLAGGARARLAIISVASDAPREVAQIYEKTFRRLGVRNASALDLRSRAEANDDEAVGTIEAATGVFFTGGNQLRITRLLGGTRLDTALHRRREEGLVIAGTSAGAAMMSNSMILGGAPDESPKVGAVEMGPGMDLLIGAVIDTHFSQRGRYGRLLTAVAHYPQDLGLGIDEKTAMIVNRNEFEVAGEGAVIVIDVGAMTYTSLPYTEKEAGLSLHGVRVHVLSAGSRFDLTKREPVVVREDGAPKKRGRGKS